MGNRSECLTVVIAQGTDTSTRVSTVMRGGTEPDAKPVSDLTRQVKSSVTCKLHNHYVRQH